MARMEIPQTHFRDGEKSTTTIERKKVPYLLWEEFEWLSYIEAYPDSEVASDIHSLLSRYLDSMKLESAARFKEWDAIAQQISTILRKYSIPELLFPRAKGSDPPFELGAGSYSIGVPYASLARFLSSEYVGRLGRCPHCHNLFVAPSDHKYIYCPGSDHKKRHWQELRSRTGYRRKDMAEGRSARAFWLRAFLFC